MPLIPVSFYNALQCSKRPAALFIFGDNIQRKGKGGQAIIRDQPNAVGLVTKHRPDMLQNAFFTDLDYDLVQRANRAAVRQIIQHLEAGKDVIWPANGVGTGRAQLPDRAPRIWAYYQNLHREFINSAKRTSGEL